MSVRRRAFPVFTFLFFCLCTVPAPPQGLYWEKPLPFSPAAGAFPLTASGKNLSVVAWQESSGGASTEAGRPQTRPFPRIGIRLAVRENAGDWKIRDAVGAYEYSGAEPSIISVTVDREGRILLAVGVSTQKTDILISEDKGQSFKQYSVDSGPESAVAPRIFTRSDGGYILFLTRGAGQNFNLYYSLSANGIDWSSFRPFVGENRFQFSFLPSLASLSGVDYVVFQSQTGSTFQLFLRSSRDNGRSWTEPVLITNFGDENAALPPNQFDNERPHLSVQRGRLFLVWERRSGRRSPQIYGADLNANGSLPGRARRINSAEAYCNNPVAVEVSGLSGVGMETFVVWFDNSLGGQRVFMSRRTAEGWERGIDLSGPSGGEASFARPAADPAGFSLFWQNTGREGSRIYSLFPDRSASPPRLRAENWILGRRTRGSLARISWTVPEDSSGIEGYSWTWSRNPDDVPPETLIAAAYQTSAEQSADEDGPWYFAIRAKDFAGNWSSAARLEFIRDTAPPPPPEIAAPETDEEGFLLSNTFDIRWDSIPGEDIAGWTWSIEYLGPPGIVSESEDGFYEAAGRRFSPAPPPGTILGTGTSASYTNQDNGLWCFSLSAVDESGNIGFPARIFLNLNRYIPRTFITYVDAVQDEQGDLSITVLGRGFSEGGLVSALILDRDGLEPWDREFRLDRGEYKVRSDREIGGLLAPGMDEGRYRIILDHPRRGLYVTPPLVSVDNTGTVKFGDFGIVWEPSWAAGTARRFALDTPFALIVVLFIFCTLGILASARGLGSVMRESAVLRLEITALITGDIMPWEKKNRLKAVRQRGIGLRFKLASFTLALALIVVVMISTPLYMTMTGTREETLLSGLWDRSSVLLEGIASGARAYMPAHNLLELGYLPVQSAALPEAHYITITGYGTSGDAFYDHVLASNDLEINSKIDTAVLETGVSRLDDNLNRKTEEMALEFNQRARLLVGNLSATLNALLREGQEIVESGSLNEEKRNRLDVISQTTQSLQTRINQRLVEISQKTGSEPAFSTAALKDNKSRSYLFFKPVLYRQSTDELYFRGLIRLEVSIDSIRDEIARSQMEVLRIILVVAFVTLAMSAIGAFTLSSIIIRPIRELVRHVERIRDTENKARLEGVDILLKSRDELAVLGNTINDMTHGLVKAALAASDMSIGKEIQKKFIPLDINSDGDKLSSGFMDNQRVEFFGYYEGAKGVSGDYFDYQSLDDGRYFAIIKCDVAGKGIPAALIMIQVATMFLNYFKQWKPTEKGFHIEELVYQINDFIETMGFKGRFAAFTLCLFDSQTGLARFCNAGDNIIHWYDASERRVKITTLNETPATGVLPNVLVEAASGYSVQSIVLDPGDILFFYTDGIEEAKRTFRDRDFREIICEEGEVDTLHETHTVGQGNEELGPERVTRIINAVMNGEIYTLRKFHNPEGEDKTLAFDFSDSEGRLEDSVMALVSVEKVFRMYKNPAAPDMRVLADKKIDEFLKKHFLQYRNYCLDTAKNPENDAYLYYTRVGEDEQYDDLTILGLRRKVPNV